MLLFRYQYSQTSSINYSDLTRDANMRVNVNEIEMKLLKYELRCMYSMATFLIDKLDHKIGIYSQCLQLWKTGTTLK